MKSPKIYNLTWPLIFGGALVLMLGASTVSADASVGWPIVFVGGVSLAAGVLLIYLRSRISDSED
ncbi:MAG: hypothetical protein CFE40_04335 [Burkholderiales bacterium PBB1]|nr:MAG: hypothetical protein CFE40_04335 [Burkholderiales bacterium PBB1]